MPALAGRSPSGIVRQLYDFKAGTRNGAGAAMMKPEVANMTDDNATRHRGVSRLAQSVKRTSTMINSRRAFLMGTAAACAAAMLPLPALAETTITIGAPMDPPEWALLQRELLHAHTAACVKFFRRYFNPGDRLAGNHRTLRRR